MKTAAEVMAEYGGAMLVEVTGTSDGQLDGGFAMIFRKPDGALATLEVGAEGDYDGTAKVSVDNESFVVSDPWIRLPDGQIVRRPR